MIKHLNHPSSIAVEPSSRWQSRGALLIVLTIIPLVASVIYSGPSFGVVSYRLMFDGGVALLWLASAGGLGHFLIRPLLGHDQTTPVILRWTSAIAMGLGVIGLLVLALGLLGWLNAVTAWGLVAVGIGLGIVRIMRVDTPATRAAMGKWFSQSAGPGWLALLVSPTVVVILVGAMFPPGLLWSPDEPHGYDVVEYHLQVPREWYEVGRIVPLHHNAFSFFPFNVEMHYLLAMHLRGGPWAGMYLAQLMHGAFMLLAVLAVYGIARTRIGRLPSMIATVAMASAPWIARLGAIAYDDGGLLLFGTLCIGWALAAIGSGKARWFVLSGLFGGLACGAKLTAVPEIIIPVFVVLVAIAAIRTFRPKLPQSAPWRGVVLFGLMAVLVFAPWMARNIAWTGNPIFPEMANIFGRDHFSQVQVERWNRAHQAPSSQQSISARIRAFGSQVCGNWQFGFVLLPLGVLAGLLSWRRQESWVLLALLILLTIFWIAFTHLQGRFYLMSLPLAALLLAQWDWQLAQVPRIAVNAAICALVTISALFSSVLLNMDLGRRLYVQEWDPMLGVDDFAWLIPKPWEQIPGDSTITLVGDARAFWYPIPMSRLRYRTIFDADTSDGQNAVDAWAGSAAERQKSWLWINPDELQRFARTYQPFPPVPSAITAHREPFLVPSDSLIR